MNYLEWKRRALLMGTGSFWLPTGLTAEDVVGAFQFKHSGTEERALIDLSGHGRNLTKYSQTSTYNRPTNKLTPEWNNDKGFTFGNGGYQGNQGYLDNAEIDNSPIRSAVVCYSDLTRPYGSDVTSRGYLLTAGGTATRAFLYASTTLYYANEGVVNWKSPGFGSASYESSKKVKTEGCVGANFGTTRKIYLDGIETPATFRFYYDESTQSKMVSTIDQGKTFGNSHPNKSDLNNQYFAGKTLIAAALFSVDLTPEQHKEVATAMLTLKEAR